MSALNPVFIRSGLHRGSLKYDFRSGSEGPRHDPYSYEEIRVDFRGKEVTVHYGLQCYIEVNGDRWEGAGSADYDNYPFKKFEEIFGFTVEQLKRWDRKLHSRCRKCDGKAPLEWVQGYPGEDLCICSGCKNVITGTFNEAAII